MTCISMQNPPTPLPHSSADKGMDIICEADIVLPISVVTVWHSIDWLTANPMAQSPSSEADNLSASQEITCLLWYPKMHYRIHKNPSLVPMLSQINPVHTLTSCFIRSILILSLDVRLRLPSESFSSGFATKAVSPRCLLHTPPISSSLIWSP